MIELKSDRGAPIFAVPYRNGRRLKPVKLPDGAIVETPPQEDMGHVPKALPAYFGLDARDEPATSGEESYVSLHGVFLIPPGQVAAVYGCTSEEVRTAV